MMKVGIMIKKGEDYLYGVWQYKVLSIKSYTRVRSFERKTNKQKLGNV